MSNIKDMIWTFQACRTAALNTFNLYMTITTICLWSFLLPNWKLASGCSDWIWVECILRWHVYYGIGRPNDRWSLVGGYYVIEGTVCGKEDSEEVREKVTISHTNMANAPSPASLGFCVTSHSCMLLCGYNVIHCVALSKTLTCCWTVSF